jgi:GGDEF domain-containing protein
MTPPTAPGAPAPPRVAVPRGQGVRQRFFVVFAIAAVIPLLSALYLALPLVRPAVAASGAYPRDPLFFWVLLLFLSILELLALYLGLDLVKAVTRLSARVSEEAGLAVPVARGDVDEIGVLGRAFSSLVATTRRQDEDLRAYGTRLEHLEDELRAANRQLRDAALSDEATSLGSARLLRLRLDDEVTRAGRLGTPVALVRVSVQGLDAVRAAGPEEAERLVRHAAASFRAVCRDADVPCRVDAATLAVLLPRSGKKAGTAVAERARQAVGEALAAHPALSLAVAVVALPDDAAAAAELWRAAGLPDTPTDPDRRPAAAPVRPSPDAGSPPIEGSPAPP